MNQKKVISTRLPGLRLSPKVPRISFKLKIDKLIFGADIFEVIWGFPKEIIGAKIGNLGLKNKFEMSIFTPKYSSLLL